MGVEIEKVLGHIILVSVGACLLLFVRSLVFFNYHRVRKKDYADKKAKCKTSNWHMVICIHSLSAEVCEGGGALFNVSMSYGRWKVNPEKTFHRPTKEDMETF
jgi:hypothetical protein